MRLPIVEYPEIVRKNLATFADLFATKEQKKHFCESVTGLIAGDEGTVSAINELFLNKNDQSALKSSSRRQLGTKRRSIGGGSNWKCDVCTGDP
jgi:hypothetical protein